jgi:phthiocerol/phenolphthiocerol synthesis type-I polyketide synthase E
MGASVIGAASGPPIAAAAGVPEGAVAVIGMAGRFPGASSVEELWENVQSGRDRISRFAVSSESGPLIGARGIVEGVDEFDAGFFGISPREAELIDPQQRAFLECAHEALERAGYGARQVRPVGVFAGASVNTYLINNVLPALRARVVDPDLAHVGNHGDLLATRVSYKLDLRGPSVTVQSACSTSLVAVHLACQSLLTRECDVALAGGASVTFPQRRGYAAREGSILSADGYCRAFDAAATGTVFSDGLGVVVLKRLEDALADGDHVHAVIRGSAVNNDGASKVGIVAPSVDGQVAVIRAALAVSDVDPTSIGYVETHGTGTRLGDQIEVRALAEAFGGSGDPCPIGSIKSGIGHLDAAAGVAGLIKAVLMVEHGVLAPSLHVEQPNPELAATRNRFYVNTTKRSWTVPVARRAAVSSFGVGGTNAHVILEQAPPAARREDDRRAAHLLVVSARTQGALDQMTDRLSAHVARSGDVRTRDIAFTLQAGRRHFEHRRAIVCGDHDDAARALSSQGRSRWLEGVATTPPAVVWLFPGQGAQYRWMAKGAAHAFEHVRRSLERCATAFGAHGTDLFGTLTCDNIDNTELAQQALFAVEYALAEHWSMWGVEPAALVGHSLGELTAACVAGVLTLEDAARVVSARARFMQLQPRGAMIAVRAGVARARDVVGARVAVAAINGPDECTLSGDATDIAKAEAALERAKIPHQRLQTSHAFHSPMMHPAAMALEEVLRDVALSPPRRPLFSAAAGGRLTNEQATDPAFWAGQLVSPVHFHDAVVAASRAHRPVFLEVGPGRTLSSLATRGCTDLPHPPVASLPTASPDDEERALLGAVGRLWVAGLDLTWASVEPRARRVALPTYPFERARHWVDPPPNHIADAPREAVVEARAPSVMQWLQEQTWVVSPRPPSRVADVGRPSWLIVGHDGALRQALLELLEADAAIVTVVDTGRGFERRDQQRYTVRYDVPEDYAALITDLRLRRRTPDRVVDLRGLDPREAGSSIAAAAERRTLESIYLARALAAEAPTQRIHVGMVTDAACDVAGNELLRPENAAMAGASLVIPQELPLIRCTHVDVILEDEKATLTRLARGLVAEIETCDASVVALRGHRRWTRSFAAATPASESPAAPPPRGVYLVTGGLGGLGLEFSEWLTRFDARAVIIVSRTRLPPMAEWRALSTTTEKHAGVVRRLLALAETGVELVLEAADVGDGAEIEAIVDRAVSRFGSLDGIIHAAGVAGGGALTRRAPEDVAAVFRGKVHGGEQLLRIAGRLRPRFVALCSSMSAYVGGPGQIDYCAANATLNALAADAAARWDLRVLCLSWATWRDVGMAANASVPASLERERLRLLEGAIAPTSGIEAFEQALRFAGPNILVSPTSAETLVAGVASAAAHSRAATGERPQLPTPYEMPTTPTEAKLTEIWSEVIGVARIGIHDDFFALGGHSLMAAQLIGRIRAAFDVDVPLHTLFEMSTVAELADAIEEQVLAELENE